MNSQYTAPPLCAIIVLVLACLTTEVTRADQIILDKGDVLHGRILKEDDQSITLNHPALGEITIQRERVIMIRPNTTQPGIPLSPMTMPSSSFNLKPRTQPKMEAAPFSIYPTPKTQQAHTATQPSPEAQAEAKAQAEKIVDNAMKDAKTKGRTGNEVLDWLDEWHFEFGLSLRGERNEKIIYALKTDFNARWKNDEFKVLFSTTYEIGWKQKDVNVGGGKKEKKLVRDIDRGNIRTEFDWFIKDTDWLIFARSKLSYDYFKDWRYRWEIVAGPGYTLWKDEEWNIQARGGINYLQNFKGEDKRPQSEALAELRVTYKPTDYLTFNLVNSFYASMNTFGESRNLTRFHVKIKLGQFIGDGVFANFKVDNDYISHPPDGDVHNDLRFRAGLSVEF